MRCAARPDTSHADAGALQFRRTTSGLPDQTEEEGIMRNDTSITLTLAAAALGAALVLPAGMAAADEGVMLRDSEAIERGYGRTGYDMYWTHRQVREVPEPIANVARKTAELATQTPEREPQRYGRAGGFGGVEKFEARGWDVTSVPSLGPAEESYGRAGGSVGG
jgi:hypothetical protein